MRILFVTFGSFLKNATLKRATGMAGPLMCAGWEVHIMMQDDPVNRERVGLECPDARICWVPEFKSPLKELAFKQKQADLIQPDVIWMCGPGIRNLLRATSGDCLRIGDYSEQLSAFSQNGLLRNTWERLLEWWYLFAFDGHVCASRHLERLFLKRLAGLRRKRPVLYLPYSYPAYLQACNETGRGSQRERNGGSVPTLLYIGSFWENYGIWDMLHAAQVLHNDGLCFKMLMLGKGPEVERAREWVDAQHLGAVIEIVGFVPESELADYLDRANAFICPLRETVQDQARCPSKLFLYLPCGLPIITCRIGEAAELLGDEAVYYKPQDVSDMAAAIARALGGEPRDAPCVDPAGHSWDARACDFLDWFRQNLMIR